MRYNEWFGFSLREVFGSGLLSQLTPPSGGASQEFASVGYVCHWSAVGR